MELVPSSIHPTSSSPDTAPAPVSADMEHEERWVQNALNLIRNCGLQISESQVISVRLFVSTHRVHHLSDEEGYAVLVKKVTELAAKSSAIEVAKLEQGLQELSMTSFFLLLEKGDVVSGESLPLEKEKLEVIRRYVAQLPDEEKKKELYKFWLLSPKERERFIVYCAHAPEGKRVDDLEEMSTREASSSLDLRTLLAHQFTFSGKTTVGAKMKLEGAYLLAVHAYLQKSVNTFYGADSVVARILGRSVQHRYVNLRELDESIARYGMIALYGGWEDHAVGALIFKDGEDYILARCNKGDECGNFPGIRFHKVGNPEALLVLINRFQNLDKKDFLRASTLQLEPCAFEDIPQQEQKVGNCTVANYHSLERAILYVLERKKGGSHAEALKESKAVHQKRARSSALHSLNQYLEKFLYGRTRSRTFDPIIIGNLLMKLPTHREIDDYDLERCMRLQKWLFEGDFSPQEFQTLKEGVQAVWERGTRKGEGTGSDAQRDQAIAWIERAERISNAGRGHDAIRALDKFLSKKSKKSKTAPTVERLEEKLRSLDPKEGTGFSSRLW